MTQQEFSGPTTFKPQGFAGQSPYPPSYAGPGAQQHPSGPMAAASGPSQYPPAPTGGQWVPSSGRPTKRLLIAAWALAGLFAVTVILTVIIRVQMSGEIDTLQETERQNQSQIATLQGQASQDQDQLTQAKQSAAADAMCSQDARDLIKLLETPNADQSAGGAVIGRLETDCVPAPTS